MGFQKNILFQNSQKNITNKIQATDSTYILYFRSSYFPGNSAYLCFIKMLNGSLNL